MIFNSKLLQSCLGRVRERKDDKKYKVPGKYFPSAKYFPKVWG